MKRFKISRYRREDDKEIAPKMSEGNNAIRQKIGFKEITISIKG